MVQYTLNKTIKLADSVIKEAKAVQVALKSKPTAPRTVTARHFKAKGISGRSAMRKMKISRGLMQLGFEGSHSAIGGSYNALGYWRAYPKRTKASIKKKASIRRVKS